MSYTPTNARRPSIRLISNIPPSQSSSAVSNTDLGHSRLSHAVCSSEPLLAHAFESCVGHGPGLLCAAALDVLQREGRRVGRALRADAEKVCARHVAQHEGRSNVRIHKTDYNVAHLKPLHVSDEEAVGGRLAEHEGFGVVRLFFGRVERGLVARAAAAVIDAYVAQADVLDVVSGDAADDGTVARVCVVGDDVAYLDAAERAHRRRLYGPARASAEAEEEGDGHVSHRDVRDGHVFEERAVNGFEREAARVVEDAVGDGDVLEAAVRLGYVLDAARGAYEHVALGV